MKKTKRITSVVFTLVFSVIVALTLVACKHEHTFGEWQKISGKCEYERLCECGEIQTQTGTHNAGNDGKCIDCHEQVATLGLIYELSNSGEYYKIVGYEGENQNVIIPSFYNGKPVTRIDDLAFYCCEILTSVTIPDSVERIGLAAFCGCIALTEVVIPDSVVTIGQSVFNECIGLMHVTIGNNVETIGNDAFEYCKKLIEVYNKSSLEIVPGKDDYGKVGYYAKNVYTPTSGTSKLLTDSNGYIIYTDGSDVILVDYVGTQTELVLPSNITEIIQYAFYDYDNLTSATIPDSVESIGEYAFYDCDSLTSVTIGNSVENIGAAAFYACNSIESVYYYGTESEWNMIEIGNKSLTTATIYYYSESEPTEEGNYWHYNDGQIEIWDR